MILSICVPTYNRVKYISELLPILITQCNEADQNCTQIEIVISDNHSDDETQTYLSTQNNQRIKKYRNDKNIGAERNYHSLVQKAKGIYIWMIGDDDLLEDHAISDVLDTINKYNCGLYIAIGNKVVIPNHTQLYSNYSELVDTVIAQNNIGFLLSHAFITCNIFKKIIYNLDFAEEKVFTKHSHPYTIANGLTENDSVFIFEKPIIKIRKERAPLHIPIPDIVVKQTQYFLYLGKKYNNRTIRIYAIKHLVCSASKTLYYDIIWKVYSIPIINKTYKKLKK